MLTLLCCDRWSNARFVSSTLQRRTQSGLLFISYKGLFFMYFLNNNSWNRNALKEHKPRPRFSQVITEMKVTRRVQEYLLWCRAKVNIHRVCRSSQRSSSSCSLCASPLLVHPGSFVFHAQNQNTRGKNTMTII